MLYVLVYLLYVVVYQVFVFGPLVFGTVFCLLVYVVLCVVGYGHMCVVGYGHMSFVAPPFSVVCLVSTKCMSSCVWCVRVVASVVCEGCSACGV